MNTAYYDTPEKINALEGEAESWIKTPFRANSCVKGLKGGVSCHNLIAAVYVATGGLPAFPVPVGSPRRNVLHGRNVVLEYVDNKLSPPFSKLTLDTPALQPGDLIGFGEKWVVHLGIVLSAGQFIHVTTDRGVMVNSLADPTWAARLLEVRRIVQ